MANTSNKLDIFNKGNCVALWQLENNTDDTSGNFTGAVDANNVYVTGVFGVAKVLDSINRIIRTTYIVPSTPSRAMSAHIKIVGTQPNTYTVFFGDGTSNSSNSTLAMAFDNSTQEIYMLHNGSAFESSIRVDATTLLTDGLFHHYLMSIASDNVISLYVDKVLTISWTPPVQLSGLAGSQVMCVTRGGEPHTEWAGHSEIDNVRIFETEVVLTDEIEALFLEDDAGLGAPTVPSAITDLAGTAGDAESILTWTAPSDGGDVITSYNVYQDDVLLSSPTGLTYTATGLTNDTAYKFEVRAVNSTGEATQDNANSISVTPIAITVPDAVTDLSTTIGDTLLNTSWSTPADGGDAITGYIVDYKLTSEPTVWTNVSRTGTTTTQQITGLVNDSGYDVRVYAVNSTGTSLVSNIATGTPVAGASAPDAITDLAGAAGDTIVDLSWTAPIDNGSAITGYEIFQDTVSLGVQGVGLTYQVTGLTNGTAYGFTITAINSVGSSAISSPSVSVTPTAPLTIPSAITDFLTTTNEVGQITCTWSNATGNPTPTYDLVNDTTSTTIATGVTSPHIYTIVDTTVVLRVDAINSQGTTASNISSGTSLPVPVGTVIINDTGSTNDVSIIGYTFEAGTALLTNVTFPYTLTIGNQSALDITVDPNVKTGNFSEVITINCNNSSYDILHTINVTEI